MLSAFNGTGPDTLTVEVNLNHASSGGNYVTKLSTIPLDTGAQYTSLVTDTLGASSGVSLTAITELKTATSPGNLWIYNQERGTTYKILGPGGAPLPAVTSFIIPTQTNGGGNLLVLVNQDNLTSANLANPPLETTPFTIIDLGQLIQAFSVETFGGTITLPFVTQIGATTPYFAMLGAAYDPVTRLVYAVVGGGSASGVTGNVISYDPFNPASPNETVVADISNIPFSFESYPQLALSAAAGTLQILTPSPSALYTVGILGTGNTAVSVPGSIFPDVSFQPTFIAANALLGETYIASASGQVDVLTNASAKPLATFTLNGNDIATTSQSYNLQATALYAVDDTALRAASVTVTATPQGSSGSAFTVAAGSFTNFAATPGNIPITLPTLGVYTLVASIPATANYPAITSNPINVTVASNFIAGVYPTALSITAPANPPTTAVNTLVTLSGSTYAPTGYINVSDANGNIVGTTYFNGGPLVQPTSVAITLVQGSNTLTASYSGDAQNAASTSPPLTVSVGTQVTPGLAITVASPATAGSSVTGNVKFTSTTANVPTGSVNCLRDACRKYHADHPCDDHGGAGIYIFGCQLQLHRTCGRDVPGLRFLCWRRQLCNRHFRKHFACRQRCGRPGYDPYRHPSGFRNHQLSLQDQHKARVCYLNPDSHGQHQRNRPARRQHHLNEHRNDRSFAGLCEWRDESYRAVSHRPAPGPLPPAT